MGKTFRDTYKFLQQSQWWSRKRIESFQFEQLQKLLHHAYNNVPYYRREFKKWGLKPGEISTLHDIAKLPFVNKKLIQARLLDFVATNIPKSRRHYLTSGGSSGIPFGFYDDVKTSFPRELAFIYSLWGRVGFKPGDPTVVLRGGVVETAERGQFSKNNRERRELVLSSLHMTDENLPEYIRIIRRFRPKFIQAYPSAITIIANYMRQKSIEPFDFLKAVLCGSENVYDWQRSIVESVLKCRLYSWYGHSERAVLAGETEDSNNYYLCPEYGYTELVDKNGDVITDEGVPGEIVATGFNNYVTPFIRYKTGDVAAWKKTPPGSRRHQRVFDRIEGRLQELIVTATGRKISMTAINMHSDVFDNIRQFQFVQEEKGKVLFNIVKKPSYTDRDTDYIIQELKKKLGADMDLSIQFVDKISMTESGKHKFLIQKLPVEFGD